MADHVSGKQLQRAELARRTGCNLETILPLCIKL